MMAIPWSRGRPVSVVESHASITDLGDFEAGPTQTALLQCHLFFSDVVGRNGPTFNTLPLSRIRSSPGRAVVAVVTYLHVRKADRHRDRVRVPPGVRPAHLGPHAPLRPPQPGARRGRRPGLIRGRP